MTVVQENNVPLIVWLELKPITKFTLNHPPTHHPTTLTLEALPGKLLSRFLACSLTITKLDKI
jgi:hypothetical protein